ncbi:signal peptidase II [Pelagibacteraceae bacterium]|nr:signal peptidase II [Pelagibacteraceae bacterium]
MKKFSLPKNVFFKKINFFVYILISLIFYLDRFLKEKIINNFSENKLFVNDFINLDLIWNTGIGFGFLSSSSSLIYNFVTGIISFVIVVLIYLTFISEKIDKIIFSFIIGGALGNLYDRLVYNAVPDFIDIHYNNFHWFTFNIADIFISIGVVFYLIKSLNEKKYEKN